MATLQVATTRHLHTESLSGILTTFVTLKGEGGEGYEGALQAGLVQSKQLNSSGQMQARNWFDKLLGAPADPGHLRQIITDLHCLEV